MAKVEQIRGALLEETVYFLLGKVGYRIVFSPSDSIDSIDIRSGRSGLEIEGRGTWHQIDAIAEQHHTPAFAYPLRLIVEAKFYTTQTVGVNIIRNAVGVLKDVTENYFTRHRDPGSLSRVRFNYQSAVFSVSGFSRQAVEYAVAHQIFLIEYKNIPVIEPIIEAIRRFDELSLTPAGMENPTELRRALRAILRSELFPPTISNLLTDKGLRDINQGIAPAVYGVGGSYFGMLQGRWPVHLLTDSPLPPEAFTSETLKCRLHGDESGRWSFTPSEIQNDGASWFELQFFLPLELAELVARQWDDPLTVARTKEQHFSFITLSGQIGGKWRSVRLELDREWLRRYVDEIRG